MDQTATVRARLGGDRGSDRVNGLSRSVLVRSAMEYRNKSGRGAICGVGERTSDRLGAGRPVPVTSVPASDGEYPWP